MARRLLDLFVNSTRNVGTQAILVDPQKITSSLNSFSSSSNYLQNLYDIFKSTIKHAKDKLQITEDLIEKLGEELSNVENLITRMSEQIEKEEELITHRKEKLTILHNEVSESRNRLQSLRKDNQWNENINRMPNELERVERLRLEREQLYAQMNAMSLEIDNLIDKINDIKEEREKIKDIREERKKEHLTDMMNILHIYGNVKHKRMILNTVAPENRGSEVAQLFLPTANQLQALEKELAELKATRTCLYEYIKDQRRLKDTMFVRNEELSNILIKNRGNFLIAKCEENAKQKSVIVAKWHEESPKLVAETCDIGSEVNNRVGIKTLLQYSPPRRNTSGSDSDVS